MGHLLKTIPVASINQFLIDKCFCKCLPLTKYYHVMNLVFCNKELICEEQKEASNSKVD